MYYTGESTKGKSNTGARADVQAEYPTEYVSFLESRIASLEGRLAEIKPDDEMAQDHLATARRNNEVEAAEVDAPGAKNEIAAGVALLSLNSASEPHYLGGSSGYSWAKVLVGTLNRPSSSLFRPGETFKARNKEGVVIQPCPDLPSKEVGAMMVDSFYTHVQARYAFVDWIKLRGWLANQKNMVPKDGAYDVTTAEGKENSTASFFIWWVLNPAALTDRMTYAIGARLLSGVAIAGMAEPEAYYKAALKHMDVIVTLHNIE